MEIVNFNFRGRFPASIRPDICAYLFIDSSEAQLMVVGILALRKETISLADVIEFGVH